MLGGGGFDEGWVRVQMQGSTVSCMPPMQDGDEATKSALLDFSYHLATSNMDEAFRAVRVCGHRGCSS